MRWIPALLAGALACMMFAGACGMDDEAADMAPTETEPAETEPTEPEPVETEPAEPATASCTNEQDGFSVDYPADWHANDGEVTDACSFFHPEEFELPPSQEVIGVAISIDREPVSFERASGEDPGTDIATSEETEIDGRPAVRMSTVATGGALLEEGTRGYLYLVDLDPETLVASTYDTGDLDLAENSEVLDMMMESLRFEPEA